MCLHMWAEFQVHISTPLNHAVCISANDVYIYQKAWSGHVSDWLRKLRRRHGHLLCKTHNASNTVFTHLKNMYTLHCNLQRPDEMILYSVNMRIHYAQKKKTENLSNKHEQPTPTQN